MPRPADWPRAASTTLSNLGTWNATGGPSGWADVYATGYNTIYVGHFYCHGRHLSSTVTKERCVDRTGRRGEIMGIVIVRET